jgi:sulfotransferase family protein
MIDALERAARERTGLEDFGAGDWRDALDRLLESVEHEAHLHDAGRAMLRMQLVDRLANRLEIEDWIERHPEVVDERIEAPLVLATLPRTGQTAAGWILDRDPANRSLLTWFAKRPCPPPEPGANVGDPRIARERTMVAAMPKDLLAMHLYDAEEPDECHWLLSNGLKTPHEIYAMRVPSYYRWVRDDPGIGATYAYYRLQLQILQSRAPGRRWVLKNSPHLLYLDALHAALPDAIFVQFHRDPLRVLASNCRLAVLLRSMASDRVDAHEVGASMLELIGDYADRLLRFRAHGVSRPWIDVRFAAFVADPVREIERIYDAAGLALGSAARERMTRWVREHPRDDRGRGTPDLSPYGIDPATARKRFAAYCDTFGVALDGI